MRPEQIQATINGALQALQSGDVARAEALAASVLRLVPRDPTSLMIAGLAAHARGNPASALEFLIRADAIAPANSMILGNLGVVYRALGRLDDARGAYEKALASDPRHIPTRANLARLLDQLGKLPEAEAHFRQILALRPGHGEALAGLASVLEQRHRLDEAEEAARQAGDNALAGLTLAKIAVRRKQPDAALATLASVRARALTPVNSALADGLEGQARELLNEVDAAFSAFTRANDTLRAAYAPMFAEEPGWISAALLSDLAQAFTGGPPPGFFDDTPEGQRDGHAFLVGFPRSGTTLMEQALAAHPGVQSIEEADNLAETLTALAEAPSVSAFFASLTADRLRDLRSAYWARVAGQLGGPPSTQVFLDKMPINSAYLGVIAKLFPKARFLFALRDPRDVMLSCFQQRFGMNAVMYRFLTLQGTSALYDGVMAAATAALQGLTGKIAVKQVRYETLAGDFEGEMRVIVSSLGLEWSPEILNFREKSRERYVSTPSAPQILEPVTRAATGKFRRYTAHLEPIMPVAEAWAAKFDYPL